MRRPNRALYGTVLGLAVLVGCAKKPKTDEVASGQTESAPAPTPSGTAQPGSDPAPSGRTQPGRIYTADDPNDSPAAPVAGGPKLGGAPTTSGSGPVALTQCRFDKVEAALSAAKGKVVLVDCWARWCGPCISSFPKLVEKHEKYGPKGLVCVSVSIDSGNNAFTPDQVHAFLRAQNATLQNFYLTDYRADSKQFTARFAYKGGIPHAVLFNKKGERAWTGHPMDGALVARIETELAR